MRAALRSNAMALPKPRVVALGALAAVFVLGAAAAWLAWRAPAAPPAEPFIEIARDAYVLAVPEPIAPFRLLRHDGAPFDLDALRGKWSFVFFGFTHCPDLCPTTLADLAQVHRALSGQPGGAQDVQFVMVSVDPERDTPQVMRAYVPAFDPQFLGVTGDGAQIAAFSKPLGVVYAKVPGTTPGSYVMDHSSSVLLLDPQGRFYGVFAAPHDPQTMALAFQRMRQRARHQ